MRQSLYDHCMATEKKYLLEEWDVEKNLSLTAKDISYGSKQNIWWRCKKGHSWQARPYSRTSGSGCPYCAGRKVDAGGTDLRSRFPDLMGEWHPTKNAGISPDQLSPGSHRKVWWRCKKGHEWQTSIKSRTSGTGCPVCAGRVVISGENDLATAYPEFIREWDAEKNAPLDPSRLAPGSKRKVWWRCEKGHSWQAEIASRVRGSGCPVCNGKKVIPGENDLASAFSRIAAQWHPTKNGELMPANCTPASNRKVWWICPLGHEYQAVIAARAIHGSDCPYCANRKILKGFNDLATHEPKIAAQWHPILNGSLAPDMVTVGSCRKVWWRCPESHVWSAVIHSRTGKRRCGCPACAGIIKRSRQARYAAILEGKLNEAD